MKALKLLTLALAGLTALAGVAAAQNAPTPNITSILPRKFWAPGNLVVQGSNLGLAFQVNLDGNPLPILRVTPVRLVAGPLSPREPGFGAVDLIHGRGVESGVVEFVPNLTAFRRGMRVTMRLNNGEPGTYVVRYSYAQSTPVVDPEVFGTRHLPLSANTLVAGIFPDASPLTLPGVTLPIELGLIGAPLRLQATCFGSTNNVTAYTNLVLLPGFGNPKGGG